MTLYKVEYLLLHLIVSIHNFNPVDLVFACWHILEQLFVRVVFNLHLEFLVYNQGFQGTYRFQAMTHELIG